jgi:hypothetical protein
MAKYRSVVVEDGGRLNNYAIEPEMVVDSTPRAGFTPIAEKLNGRIAMLGFVTLIGLEYLSGHSLVDLLHVLG